MHYFSNLFDNVLYMFRTGHCPSSGLPQHCIHASRQPTELAWQIPMLCIQCWDTPHDGQWKCPKHAE